TAPDIRAEVPFEVPCDDQVEQAVAIVVDEESARRPASAANSRPVRYLREGPVPVVVIEDVAVHVRDIKVSVSVVVVICGGGAHTVPRSAHAGADRYIRVRPLAIVGL